MRVAVTVAMVAAALSAGGCGSSSNRALDPSNELPLGRIDSPAEGAQVTSSVTIGGWALDDRGVRAVRVYIDGHFANETQPNTDRPDVAKAFPQYARETTLHGWTLAVSFAAPGPHVIIAQAVDSDGATRDIGTVNVTSRDQ
jgi:hypothetical protein